jgi:hypothetical protein
MTELPAEWEHVAAHVRWPQPDLRRSYVNGKVVLEDPEGRPIMQSDTVADDLIDDLEKGAPE